MTPHRPRNKELSPLPHIIYLLMGYNSAFESDQPDRDTDNSGWRPRNPPEDFTFPAAHPDNFDPDDWPADPSAYRPSSHFRQRFRDYDRCFTGDRLRETIEAGNRIPALRDTCAFYLDCSGAAFYVIVGWDLSMDNPARTTNASS